MNLNKDPSSWERVSPEAVLSGSEAQRINVLTMAKQDIARLDAELRRAMNALAIADDLVAFHRDYSTMPSDDFRAKYGYSGGQSTAKFCRLRADYVEARATMTVAMRIRQREGL